jgi:hypothetical protein
MAQPGQNVKPQNSAQKASERTQPHPGQGGIAEGDNYLEVEELRIRENALGMDKRYESPSTPGRRRRTVNAEDLNLSLSEGGTGHRG